VQKGAPGEGTYVGEVRPDSEAEKVGVQSGDLLSKVAGTPVTTCSLDATNKVRAAASLLHTIYGMLMAGAPVLWRCAARSGRHSM
jgi:hypothetical protein